MTGQDELEKVSSEIDIIMDRELQTIAEGFGLDKIAHLSLHDRLKRIANRTYLRLHLVLTEIRHSLAQTEKDFGEVLEIVPETAEDAYKRAFETCIAEETTQRILHIILAAQRSLTLMEIDVALEVDETLKEPNDSASLSLLLKGLDGDIGKTRIAVQDACGLFINIVDSRVFLSRTAKEFLLREIEESSEQRRWTKSINITEGLIKTAVETRHVGLVQLLLQQQGVNDLITEDVVKAAATSAGNSYGREVMMMLLDQPGASTLITEDVWKIVSELRYSSIVTLLKSLLGKTKITEDMTATFVRIFSRKSVELLLDLRGADVSITAEVMNAALENANRREEIPLFLYNRYESEASKALTQLGE